LRATYDQALLEYRQYCADFKARRVAESVLASLERLGDRNLIDPTSDERFWARVRDDVVGRKPFSLLRLGDGEGNVLFHHQHRERYPDLAHWCLSQIWRQMFGQPPRDAGIWSRLASAMAEAVLGADYLGLPFAADVEWGLQEGERRENLESKPIHVRGAGGYIPVWDFISLHALDAWFGQITVSHRLIHAWSSGYFGGFIEAAGNVSIVSCYPDLLHRLHQAGKVTSGRAYRIPPQASNVKTTQANRHFPERYEEIDTDLARQDLTGRLFFVGAGLIGKLYCDRIKRQGGMAVDVGSMMDVWMGVGVRRYQHADYIKQCNEALLQRAPINAGGCS
jgi:hypothetical protein